MSSQRRQMMQPWPLCLMPSSFSRSKDQSILPKFYSRVPALSSTTCSTISQDCASNTTLLTNASPFNSQQALISDKKRPSNNGLASSHYYAENLRHENDLRYSTHQVYNLSSKNLTDYKQLEPLIVAKDQLDTEETEILMESPKSNDVELAERKMSVSKKFTKRRNQFIDYFPQVLAALAVSCGSMIVGFASGWTSPAESSLTNPHQTSFEVTNLAFTWVGAIMPLHGIFGGIAGGPCIEYLGRRNTILATAFPFIGAWLLMGSASHVWMVLLGRALCGFCMGILTLSFPVYLGETIQPEIRGTLGLFPTAFGNIGILICYSAGMHLDWSKLAYLGACTSIPFLLLMFFIPETPNWYVSKEKTKKAQQSLQWLRGKSVDISEEFAAVEKTQSDSERESSASTMRELTKINNFKPLIISMGLMFFQQMSGINAVIFYTNEIFEKSNTSLDKNICSIIVAIVNFLSSFMAAAVIDKLGRKTLLYISSIVMIITLMCLGTYFYVLNQKYDVAYLSWLPLTTMIVYVIGFSLGFGPIPWLMMGEILPAKVRGPAASIATGFNWLCVFIVALVFPTMAHKVGEATSFWLFNGFCVAGLVFVVFCVPETKGRSLDEIEKRLTGPVRRMSAVANMKPVPTAC